MVIRIIEMNSSSQIFEDILYDLFCHQTYNPHILNIFNNGQSQGARFLKKDLIYSNEQVSRF